MSNSIWWLTLFTVIVQPFLIKFLIGWACADTATRLQAIGLAALASLSALSWVRDIVQLISYRRPELESQ